MRTLLFPLLILLILSACSNSGRKANPKEFMRWEQRHHDLLKAEKEINGITYTLNYIPNEWMVLRNYDLEKRNDLDSIKQMINQVKQQYFTFKIGPSKGNKDILYHQIKSNAEYDKRILYYAFEVKNDLLLVEGKDTLRCLDSHFERTYGLTPYITLNLVFPEALPGEQLLREQDIHFIFEDVVFNSGRIRLMIPKENLKKIPILN